MADESIENSLMIQFCGPDFGYKNDIYLIFDSGT